MQRKACAGRVKGGQLSTSGAIAGRPPVAYGVEHTAFIKKKHFEEALFVRPQISATRLPGFRRAERPQKRIRKAVRAEAREHLRTSPPQHARNPHRLALRRVWSSAPEYHRSGRAMSQVQLRPARLQTVRTLRSFEPLRMQSAHPRQNLSQRQTQRLPVVLHPRDDRKRNIQQTQSASERRARRV